MGGTRTIRFARSRLLGPLGSPPMQVCWPCPEICTEHKAKTYAEDRQRHHCPDAAQPEHDFRCRLSLEEPDVTPEHHSQM